MTTYLLVWNPERWVWPDDEYTRALAATAAGSTWSEPWSVGVRRAGIEAGDRAFLVRQRRARGIARSGSFADGIYTDPHWDGSGRAQTYAPIDWDVLLPEGDELPVADLKQRVPAVNWDRLQASGVLIGDAAAATLEAEWKSHVDVVPYRLPEEADAARYSEGELVRVEVNRCERGRRARAACIRHHGLSCAVCALNYEETYGVIGRDFIHVHHIKDLSLSGPNYQVDPARDLRPVCANCHSMLHTRRPAMKIEQLQAQMRNTRGGR